MWQLLQVSGLRACSRENSWRLWQAEQRPAELSGCGWPIEWQRTQATGVTLRPSMS